MFDCVVARIACYFSFLLTRRPRLSARVSSSPASDVSTRPLQWQQQLARYGYGLPQHGAWDEQSRAALRAFQLHFRPALVTGEPDAECQAILTALLERYFP